MAAGSKGIRAGRAYVELGMDDKTRAGLEKARARLTAFGKGLTAVGLQIGGLALATGGGFVAAAATFSKVGDDFAKTAARIGVSTEAVSALAFAAERSGASLSDVETGFKFLGRTISEAAGGSKEAAKALTDVGLSVSALRGMSPVDQFMAVADAMAGIGNSADRTNAAMQLLGRSGTTLIPLFEGGSKGLADLFGEASRLGLIMSGDAGRSAEALNDALGDVRMTVRGVVLAIGEALAPTVTEVSNRIATMVGGLSKFIRENKRLVVGAALVTAGVAGLGAALAFGGVAMQGLAIAMGAVAKPFSLIAGFAGSALTIVKGLGAAMIGLLSPINLVIAAIGAVGIGTLVATGAAGDAINWLGEKWRELRAWVSESVGIIVDSLKAGDIESAAEVGWASLKLVWVRGISFIQEKLAEGLDTMKTWWIETFAAIEQVAAVAMASVANAITQTGGFVTGGLGTAALILNGGKGNAVSDAMFERSINARKKVEERNDQLEQKVNKIESDKGRRLDQAWSAQSQSVREATADLEEAQKALAVAQKNARASLSSGGLVAKGFNTEDFMSRIREGMAGAPAITGSSKWKEDFVGTFNPFAVQGATGNEPILARIADATRDTAAASKAQLRMWRSAVTFK